MEDSQPGSKGEAQDGACGERVWRPQSSSISLTGLSAPRSLGATSYRKHPLNHSFLSRAHPCPSFFH